MDPTFNNIITVFADLMFNGSTTLAGLALLIGAWVICTVVCYNMKAPPTYTVVPMIALCIFFTAYGILDETISIIIILVSSVLVASEFKKVVD